MNYKTKNELLITSERDDRMIQPLRRNDRTCYQIVHTQARFYFFSRIPHMNDRVTHWELKVLAYVRVQAHDIYILNSLVFPRLIVLTHGLCSTPVQGITGTQRTLSYYRMRQQFRLLFSYTRILKLTPPLYFDLTLDTCHLL